MLETLDYTIRIGSTPTFLYFDLCLHSAYAALRIFIMTLLTQLTTVNAVVFFSNSTECCESNTNVYCAIEFVSFPGDEFVERARNFLVYCGSEFRYWNRLRTENSILQEVKSSTARDRKMWPRMWLYCRLLFLERIISFLLYTIEGMWCYCLAYGSLVVCIWLKIHQETMGACILNLISVLDVQYLRYVPATYPVNVIKMQLDTKNRFCSQLVVQSSY